MALSGQIFAEREPVVPGKRCRGTQEALDFSEIACTEFGTLPRETIIHLGLRHVYTMPVVLEDNRTKQVLIYHAEVYKDKKWRTVYVQESVDGADEGWHKLRQLVPLLMCWCRDFLRAVKLK